MRALGVYKHENSTIEPTIKVDNELSGGKQVCTFNVQNQLIL